MLPVWTRLEELVNNYLDSVTLEDIRNQLRESKTAKTI